jgi:hypothetical protein
MTEFTMPANICIQEIDRDAITTKERSTQSFLSLIYLMILLWSMQRVVVAYKKRRKKEFHFIPRINLLFFVVVYARFTYMLDSLPVLWHGGFLYKMETVRFLDLFSFVSYLLVCVYSTVIW